MARVKEARRPRWGCSVWSVWTTGSCRVCISSRDLIRRIGAPAVTRSATPMSGASQIRRATAFYGIAKRAEDSHDLIEWLAEQDWCTGKVAMSGTSYLAVAQWFAAAEQPPHLAAINPWEGVSDVYRDLVMRGGMPDTGFARQLQENSYWGKSRKEDILAEAERYPLMNDLWRNKIPRFDRIEVPAYVVASYSNSLHTAGTFRAWRRMGSDQEMAAHSQQSGVARLLRRGEPGRSAPVLRSLPEGRGQRLGADPAGPVLPS